MSDIYVVTGIQDGLGPFESIPVRREVDEWWSSSRDRDINQKALFIHALRHFQSMDPLDELSYFQISGIHGQPLSPWKGATAEDARGYGIRGTPLFATWNRVYVALFEQRLHEIMKTVVIPNEFDKADHANMYEAARTWRLPYWDWALPRCNWKNPDHEQEPNIPQLLMLSKVYIRTGKGYAFVANPLWQFRIPQKGSKDEPVFMKDHGVTNVPCDDIVIPYGDTRTTVKHPRACYPGGKHNFDNEEQRWEIISDILAEDQGGKSNSLGEEIYRLFNESYTPNFDSFVTSRFSRGQSLSSYLSLEGISNKIHHLLGGSGHLAYIPVAAFDPMFWLHHNNIDRLVAIWQDLYPHKWVEAQQDDFGRPLCHPNDPLIPFHSEANDGDYHTSESCRHTTSLGYAFEELRELPLISKDTDESRILLRALLDDRYGATSSPVKYLSGYHCMGTSTWSGANHFGPASLMGSPIWTHNDYIVNIQYDRFGLNGDPYLVTVYLGGTDGKARMTSVELDSALRVGSVYNFSASPDAIGECSQDITAHRRSTTLPENNVGQVILTNALAELVMYKTDCNGLRLHSFDEAEVTYFLKRRLQWRVTNLRDNFVNIKKRLPNLKVSVALGTATHRNEPTQSPTYGNYKILIDVTADRHGGLDPHDAF